MRRKVIQWYSRRMHSRGDLAGMEIPEKEMLEQRISWNHPKEEIGGKKAPRSTRAVEE